MMRKTNFLILLAVCLPTVFSGCATKKEPAMNQDNKITLMVLDPGHFHASLVQKEMYPGVDSTVYVYAPGGMELDDYINRVTSYNEREEEPTAWHLEVYTGQDFLEKMLKEQPGNLVVLAGNNQRKTEYIDACIDAGLHVYSDKPMAIEPSDFELLRSALEKADEKGLLLYDIMTERFEITTILQKKLSEQEAIFGGLVKGTVEEPAITKESVHHFFKYVSGSPLQRPAWFFDVRQEGEAIADVGTHLVDLVMWEAVPEGVADYVQDIRILESRRWSTSLSAEQFSKVTGLETFPSFLAAYIVEDTLRAIANSAIDYTVKGIHARVSVEWAFQAPEGAGDTHYSIMRGNTSDLIIRQGEAENYRPELYIRAGEGVAPEVLQTQLELYLEASLGEAYPGIAFEKLEEGLWRVSIPNKYRKGHEAHFAQVTRKFLGYMEDGKLPEWEVEQMLAKYYTTTRAVELATD